MPLKAILNSLILGVTSSIFTIGFNFFGAILLFFSYFSPLPIFIVTLFYGLYGTILSALISVSIIVLMTSAPIGIIFFIANIAPSIIILMDRKSNEFSYQNFISKLTLINGLLYAVIMLLYPDKINTVIKNFSNYLQNSLGNNLKIETAILDMTPSIIISTWGIILLLNFKDLNQWYSIIQGMRKIQCLEVN